MFQAYLITCLINNRQYIGITSRGLRHRWSEHVYDSKARNKKMAISRAIAKYGAENFRMDALCSARSWEDICAVEPILIIQWKTRRPNGYNISEGGEGPFGVKRTAESVERSASKHRGKPCHPNTRAAAMARKGHPKPHGHGAKVAAARRGKPCSDEVKAKLSAYWAARRATGAFKTDRPYAHARTT